MHIEVKEATLKADESEMKQLFLNKNELHDTLKEKGVFKCIPLAILKVLKKLKESKLNEKAMVYYLKNFRMIFEIPS